MASAAILAAGAGILPATSARVPIGGSVTHPRAIRSRLPRARAVLPQADTNSNQSPDFSFRLLADHEAQRSQLEAVKKVALTLKEHLLGLLEYFNHRITNAVTEAFNATIQSLKAVARGFRNFEHYRTRILFFLGRLDLSPL